MIKILLVEDDHNLNDSTRKYLTNNGFDVISSFNGEDAIERYEDEKFDLIITDIMMPNMDGFELADAIRINDKHIPIIFMTAKDDIKSKEKGYDIGIDDYIVKPFELSELKMRINAIIKRLKIEEKKEIKIGNFIINEEEHSALYNDDEMNLTVKEFQILFKLLSYPKKTFSRGKLMDEFWGYDSSATSRAVDVCVSELRKKVSKVEEFEIVTVHGLGYKVILK